MQNGARLTHIFGQVCACGFNDMLPSVFARHDGHKCLLWTPDILLHLHLNAAATRQRHAVRPDCSGRVAHHGASPLTSANRRSPGHGTGFGARQFMSRGSVQGYSCRGARSETIPQLGTIWLEVKWSRFRSWQPARVLAGAQPERPIRVTTSLRVVASAAHHRIYKRTGRGAVRGVIVVVPESSSFLSYSCVVVPDHRSRLLVPECRPCSLSPVNSPCSSWPGIHLQPFAC